MGGILLVLMAGCASTEQTTSSEEPNATLASLYNPSQLSLHPDYSVFHEDDDFSVIYIRAYPGEMRFSQANEDSEYRALLQIKYRLIMLDDQRSEGMNIDSATVVYKMVKGD